MTLRKPIVWVTGAAALVALLVIARPVINPTADPVRQTSNQATTTRTGPLPVVPVVDLNLDRLKTAGRELPPSQRDPFRFRPKAPPPAQRVQAPPPVFAPPAPPGPPPIPQIPLRLIGTFRMVGQPGGTPVWVASFRDERGNVFSGKEGEILEGRYRVLRISENAADLAYLDGRGRQTLRRQGQ